MPEQYSNVSLITLCSQVKLYQETQDIDVSHMVFTGAVSYLL
jgi:hypothetical protein